MVSRSHPTCTDSLCSQFLLRSVGLFRGQPFPNYPKSQKTCSGKSLVVQKANPEDIAEFGEVTVSTPHPQGLRRRQ
jgi:hypothetical protein